MEPYASKVRGNTNTYVPLDEIPNSAIRGDNTISAISKSTVLEEELLTDMAAKICLSQIHELAEQPNAEFQRVIPGNIIVRQRGTRFHPENYVVLGKDHTLYKLKEGCAKFQRQKLSGRKFVHIEPKDGHVVHPVYTTNVAPKLETVVHFYTN
ncbi:hypothetical protein GIB67_021951 [Kingdonia uniflora]|uniref:Uncharacterized protein n=1 Tax=Kingdonia uniflora TaxID=39325 RepID=A0A7J7P7N6_9MAGN|nr:hypothetical protein GIB67_021951 [Kingdonia uniflora]